MEKVLIGLQWTIFALCLDKIIIFAKSHEEHQLRQQTVFDRCGAAGLKLKPKDCDFLKRSVSFLGHVVDEECIRNNPDKIQTVLDWMIPANVTHLHSFIGLTYFRWFICNYAALLAFSIA